MSPEPITYVEHAQDVLGQAVILAERGQQFALISSVAIQGGTARELGSLAVVATDGTMTGYLSNGCIDSDILANGMAALEDGERRIVHYGAGSPFHDLTLPCGGMLKVLVDPKPDLHALARAYEDFKNRRIAYLTFEADERLTIEYAPKPHLVLAGRGAIFRSTAQVAKTAGFQVECLSPEVSDLEALRPLCHGAPIHLKTQEMIPMLALDKWSAFLTLFHDHDWEPPLLLAAVKTDAAFVGALGSRPTHAARIAALEAMGCAPDDIARIKGPVGLVPSLRSANLIAASIIAELGAVFSRSQRRVEGVRSVGCTATG
ncbi:MAG: XdhC family protein [Pseudomonadota bacterium]